MLYPGENHGGAYSIKYWNVIKHNHKRWIEIKLLKDTWKDKPKIVKKWIFRTMAAYHTGQNKTKEYRRGDRKKLRARSWGERPQILPSGHYEAVWIIDSDLVNCTRSSQLVSSQGGKTYSRLSLYPAAVCSG